VEQITITGQLGVGRQTLPGPDGEPRETDIIFIRTSPFHQYVIPLPDDAGLNGEPGARTIVKDHLNSGVQVAGVDALEQFRKGLQS
jgi:hypothetical protein